MTLSDLVRIYEGSDGVVTKALYAQLEALGQVGVIAVNLFRAQKCSARAKVYRGHGYKDEAYRRKQWSMDNLCTVLEQHAWIKTMHHEIDGCGPACVDCADEARGRLPLTWGWREDPAQEFHRWVLYIDLPTGQVSFHTDRRGTGPDYRDDWDGRHDVSAYRILRWIALVFERQALEANARKAGTSA